VAVIADGSTPTQRVVRTTLDRLAVTLADEGIRPPAVWVVGDVVGLAPRL
jgi:uroporphyrin-III C-methyltransferase/precorrin-2 dehydrogenase/sirohydrochlorin ferrochelatase